MSAPTPYPRSSLAVADAWSVIVVWLTMPPFLVLLLTQGTGNEFSPWLMGVAAVLGTAVLAHLGLAFAHRCPNCTKHPTLQGFKPTHPAALSQSSLSGWGGAVMNIVKRHRLVCVHCGSAYSITQ